MGSGSGGPVGSASRDLSAAVQSALDELIKVLTLAASFPLTISERSCCIAVVSDYDLIAL